MTGLIFRTAEMPQKAIKEKLAEMLTKELFYNDNAPTKTSVGAMATIQDCGYDLAPHLPYSPDLAPRTFIYSPQN